MMGRLGLTEMLVILVIVILLFGAKRLPEIGRSLGKAIKEFKKADTESDSDNQTPSPSDDQK